MVVFFVFVLFSTHSINLFHEWNPPLKKSFSYFFYTYKNRFDFFKIPKSDFLFLFYYYHKIDLIFYKSKTIFS